jgi:hypothetical protein
MKEIAQCKEDIKKLLKKHHQLLIKHSEIRSEMLQSKLQKLLDIIMQEL